LYPNDFRWARPPYEYVQDKLPIDVILGDANVRQSLEAGRSILEMEREWTTDLEEFMKVRARYLLYPT
jgi:uncharacterized protein YbbC (DUF1343 family)